MRSKKCAAQIYDYVDFDYLSTEWQQLLTEP
jgi:hypothetical protein